MSSASRNLHVKNLIRLISNNLLEVQILNYYLNVKTFSTNNCIGCLSVIQFAHDILLVSLQPHKNIIDSPGMTMNSVLIEALIRAKNPG